MNQLSIILPFQEPLLIFTVLIGIILLSPFLFRLIKIHDISSFIIMGVWAVVVSFTQFMLQVNDKFGPGILWKFITGKYFHPREEEKIFDILLL